MSHEGQAPHLPRPRKLMFLSFAALFAATLLVFCFVLPAEYGFDLTGFGRLSGLNRIAEADEPEIAVLAPASGTDKVAHSYAAAYRTNFIDIIIPGGDGELEYKVHMKNGAALVYSWNVEGYEREDLFYYDFHSENWPRAEGEKQRVAEYEQQTGVAANGALIAPFDGVHGWYLQNQGTKPVTVHLRISGFYNLIAPGEYGNLEGILPAR